MRGFSFGEVKRALQRISTGPQSITCARMDTAGLAQSSFLKGPSSLMTGLDAIGGSVNYVSREPTRGPVRNEFDVSVDSLGSVRSHFGSGGSTTVKGLDYRFDVVGSRFNGFNRRRGQEFDRLSSRLNLSGHDAFKVFAAIEYKRDAGHAYWGHPRRADLLRRRACDRRASFRARPSATFDGSIIAPVTIDSRTLKTKL